MLAFLPLAQAAEEEASGGLIDVVPGLMIWTLICFAITFYVLKRFAFGPIQRTIDERRDRIRKAVDEADHARTEARQLLEQHQALIAQAKGEAAGILAEARKVADAQVERVKGEAEEERLRRLEETRRQIEAETKRSLDLIRADDGHVLLGGQSAALEAGWKTHVGSYLDESFLIDFLRGMLVVGTGLVFLSTLLVVSANHWGLDVEISRDAVGIAAVSAGVKKARRMPSRAETTNIRPMTKRTAAVSSAATRGSNIAAARASTARPLSTSQIRAMRMREWRSANVPPKGPSTTPGWWRLRDVRNEVQPSCAACSGAVDKMVAGTSSGGRVRVTGSSTTSGTASHDNPLSRLRKSPFPFVPTYSTLESMALMARARMLTFDKPAFRDSHVIPPSSLLKTPFRLVT